MHSVALQADGPVRAAPVAAFRKKHGRLALFFGDQIGNFYSLDASTGKLLWKRRLDDHVKQPA
jgi:outer membrane protein assembly factor BamB